MNLGFPPTRTQSIFGNVMEFNVELPTYNPAIQKALLWKFNNCRSEVSTLDFTKKYKGFFDPCFLPPCWLSRLSTENLPWKPSRLLTPPWSTEDTPSASQEGAGPAIRADSPGWSSGDGLEARLNITHDPIIQWDQHFTFFEFESGLFSLNSFNLVFMIPQSWDPSSTKI